MDKQTGHDFSGFVRQATVGTELEVPVPRKMISTTVAIVFVQEKEIRDKVLQLSAKSFSAVGLEKPCAMINSDTLIASWLE